MRLYPYNVSIFGDMFLSFVHNVLQFVSDFERLFRGIVPFLGMIRQKPNNVNLYCFLNSFLFIYFFCFFRIVVRKKGGNI